jgi:hypothetical protein
MIISNFNLCKEGGTVRVEAQIKWEDLDRPPFMLFVQTVEEFEDVIWPDPNAFLVASFLPAWYFSERRIKIIGSVCPVLLNNLKGAFLLLKTWYPNDFGSKPVIEPTRGVKTFLPFKDGVISLLSGGIDSLSILRANKLTFPSDHPHAVKATLSVTDGEKPAKNSQEFYEQVKGRLIAAEAIAKDAGVSAIPVISNVWWLNPGDHFYSFKSHGAQLSAISSLFSRGFHKGYIASSFDAAFLHKHWGSHPQLDAYYTSGHFQTEHTGTEMTRFEKTALVADWPVALQHIRVCQNDSTGSSNCGTCEKCIRTMTMLEALGKLRKCTSFPDNYVSSSLLYYLETYNMLFDVEQIYLYKMTIPHLKKQGRNDLVRALEKIIQSFHKKTQHVL